MKLVATNVYSFKAAAGMGFLYQQYTYDSQKIPLGEFSARLDFKIWSRRILAINCYFTKIGTGERFVVRIYCNNETAKFQVMNSTIDFAQCPVGIIYSVQIIKNEKGKVLLAKLNWQTAPHLMKIFLTVQNDQAAVLLTA